MASTLKRRLLPVLIIIIAVAIMLFLFGSRTAPQKKEEIKKDLLVEVVDVKIMKDNFKVQSQGTVQPKIISTFVSEVSGKIVEVSPIFVNGGLFKKGDVLLKIDPSDYQTSVKSSQAALARAKATLEEEKARAQVAEKEWQQFMDGEAPDLYLRKPQLAREVANVKAAEADVERSKRELARTSVIASFDGLIKAKKVDLGQFVNRGTAVAEVYGTEIAEVRLPISDLDMNFLSFNSAYELQTQKPKVELVTKVGNRIRSWQATVVRSEGIIDERNRLLYLVAEVIDPYGLQQNQTAIEFGRFVQATIVGKKVENLVLVPRDLIFEANQVLVAKDKKLVIQPVTIVQMDKKFAYVSEGLTEGDKLIITNIKNPLNGAAIRLLSEIQEQKIEDSKLKDKELAGEQ